MSAGDIAATVSALASAVAAVVAYAAFWYTRSRGSAASSEAAVRAIVKDMISGLATTVAEHAVAEVEFSQRVRPLLTMTVERVNVLGERIGVVETKIDVFWKNVAYDAARILHSPHTPEFDVLLDGFLEGKLNTDDTVQFVKELAKIVNDRGQLNGDRLAAATIIRVIEQQGAGT